MSKKIARILPLPMKPIGEMFAMVHCRDLGLGKGTQEFTEEYNSYVFNFNDEAYGMSMTPSGLIGNNHQYVKHNASPKISETYFDLTKGIFGEEGFLNLLDTTPEKKVLYKRQLRGNIASIVHLLLETKYGAKIKGKNGEYSDFQHRKGETPEERTQTLLNQYLRLFYTVKIIKALEKIFDKEPQAVSDLLDGVFGNAWKKQTEAFLFSKNNRVNFVNSIYSKSDSPSSQAKPIKKENPTPVNRNTYKADNGLYFDKNKIDSISDTKRDEVCHLTPKREYVKKFDIPKEEYMKANFDEPVIFGSYIKDDFKVDYFIIRGKEILLKCLENGIPVLDSIKLTPEETLRCGIVTQSTRAIIDRFLYNLKTKKSNARI
jgi:hypothetical protein